MPLSGKTICFTGKLETPRKDCESKATAAGAKVLAGVSKNLDILVAGPGAGSKAEKAAALGTEVWDQQQFKDALRGDVPFKKRKLNEPQQAPKKAAKKKPPAAKKNTTATKPSLLEALVASGVELQKEEPGLEEDDKLSLMMFPRTEQSDEGAGEPYQDWCISVAGKIQEKYASDSTRLYSGERAVLEEVLNGGRKKLIKSFRSLPGSVKWVIREVCEPWTDCAKLIPSLEGDDGIYVLLPTSAQLALDGSTLSIPDPDARSAAEGTYMAKDVWFEDCGDGGLWIIGIGDKVLILYVDSPGDTVCGRYFCERKRWNALWIATFGATHVSYPS